MSDSLPDLFPDLRHNQIAAKTPNTPRQSLSQADGQKLIRFLQKHLHANTNTE